VTTEVDAALPQRRIFDTSRFQPATRDWFLKVCGNFGALAQRYRCVASVHAEVARIARGKSFTIHDAAMWRMALAERDMVAIDAASWARGLYDGRGFLRALQGVDLSALRLEWNGQSSDGSRLRSFERLFPEAAFAGRIVPEDRDREELVDRLDGKFRPLLLDRDKFRAHRFEQVRTGNAKMLDLSETAEHLLRMQELIIDVFLLSAFCSYQPWELDADPEDIEARDVVDLILCGPLNWIVDGPPAGRNHEAPLYRQRRASYYERLHAEHEKGAPEEPFNGPFLS